VATHPRAPSAAGSLRIACVTCTLEDCALIGLRAVTAFPDDLLLHRERVYLTRFRFYRIDARLDDGE
jgi:hypothetical protein